MRSNMKAMCGVGMLLLGAAMAPSRALSAEAYPVFTDVNVEPQTFGATAGFFGGLFIPNDTATLNGNQVLAINQNGQLECCHGALIEVNISNGENGVSQTAPPGHPGTPEGTPNFDADNMEPPNPVFAAIGNASGKLENGNVIRFSAWFRSDPANPITIDPQVQPILKIEYWKEALSDYADTTGVKVAPGFGDRIFDQDQQGSALGIPELPHWVDIDGDGVVLDGSATVGNGRVTQISTSEWRLAEITHTVNSADWLGIGAEGFGFDDVGAIETVKAVMFMGDFAMTDLTGDGPDGGNLLIDNILVEVFKDAASITANTNPDPALSEGADLLGDYNENGTVDAADYTVWRDNLGDASSLPNDDSIGVGTDDYDRWKTQFGMTAPGSGALLGAASAVPEPTGGMLVAIVMLAGIVSRRGRPTCS